MVVVIDIKNINDNKSTLNYTTPSYFTYKKETFGQLIDDDNYSSIMTPSEIDYLINDDNNNNNNNDLTDCLKPKYGLIMNN